MKNNYLILSTPNHPFFDQLEVLDCDFINIYDEDDIANNDHYDCIFDFTLVDKEEKLALIDDVTNDFGGTIISDLTCQWGELFFEKYKKMIGAVSLSFPSPTETYEYCAKNTKAEKHIKAIFFMLGVQGKKVSSPGIGFIYPRTISMIINEAFFALDSHLATEEDIDTAMKYGVNYPEGPFRWAENIGHENVLLLLDELFDVTEDPRYRPSKALKLLAYKD